MGALTLSQLREEVRTQVGGRRDLNTTTDARVNLAINDGYRYIAQPNVYQHRETQSVGTITLATDDVDYNLTTALAATPQAIHSVYYHRGTTIAAANTRTRLVQTDIRKLEETQFPAGEPREYALFGNDLYIDRRPTATQNGQLLRVFYWAPVVALSGTTDTTVLRTEWDEVLIQAATWFLFKRLRMFAEAELAKADLDAAINNKLDIARAEAEDLTDGLIDMDIELHMEDHVGSR